MENSIYDKHIKVGVASVFDIKILNMTFGYLLE